MPNLYFTGKFEPLNPGFSDLVLSAKMIKENRGEKKCFINCNESPLSRQTESSFTRNLT